MPAESVLWITVAALGLAFGFIGASVVVTGVAIRDANIGVAVQSFIKAGTALVAIAGVLCLVALGGMLI